MFNSSSKVKITVSLAITVCVLTIANIWLSAQLSDVGHYLNELQEHAIGLESMNDQMSTELTHLASLYALEEYAKQNNFSNTLERSSLSNGARVAQR